MATVMTVEPATEKMRRSMTLTCDKWYLDRYITDQLNEVSFAGYSFMDILGQAMRLVFYDENGNPGLLYQGESHGALHPAAVATVRWNGGRMNGFSDVDLGRTLSQGLFPQYADWIDADGNWVVVKMVFCAPQPIDTDHVLAYAYASQPGTAIFYNARVHKQVALDLHFPQNDEGISRLIWLSGATILHEVVHNQGFGHPYDVNYDPGSDYASTLPFVAERAVLMNSPYWPEFDKYYRDGVWLLHPGHPTCATR